MKVLSLFDGMACGMIAFKGLGIPIERYTAYEIDKFAIKTALHNFPEIEECGDVFEADFKQYEGVDWLIGGSPCTYWSIAQSPDKRETTASGMGWELFSQYVRALREAKPKYFIYENNKSMAKAIYQSISETFGFEPIMINSALVSAQNRQRYYWVGIRQSDGTYKKADIEQPADRGILLKDILNCGVAYKEKQNCIDANYYKGGNFTGFKKQSGQRLSVAEPVGVTKDGKSFCSTARYYKGVGTNPGKVLEKCKDSMVAEPVDTHTSAKYLLKNFKTESEKTGTLTASSYKDIGADGMYTVCEPVCVASRGRYKDGESEMEQRLEVRGNKTNSLTTVQKDNMVCEPVNTTVEGKSQCLRATCYKDTVRNIVGNNLDRKTGVAEPVRVAIYPTSDGRLLDSQGMRVYSVEGKSVTQSAQGGDMGAKTGLYAIPVEFDNNIPTKAVSCADGKTYTVYEVKDGQITIKEKTYPIKLADGYYIIRKLTISECKRLQTVPEWYEFPVSNTQAYKMLGNGWTVDVIAHILKNVYLHLPVEERPIGIISFTQLGELICDGFVKGLITPNTTRAINLTERLHVCE